MPFRDISYIWLTHFKGVDNFTYIDKDKILTISIYTLKKYKKINYFEICFYPIGQQLSLYQEKSKICEKRVEYAEKQLQDAKILYEKQLEDAGKQLEVAEKQRQDSVKQYEKQLEDAGKQLEDEKEKVNRLNKDFVFRRYEI